MHYKNRKFSRTAGLVLMALHLGVTTASIHSYHVPQRNYRPKLIEAPRPITSGIPIYVDATAYTAKSDSKTATGTVPALGKTIAVDPKQIPLGTRVYIPKLDSRNPAFKEFLRNAARYNELQSFLMENRERFDGIFRTEDTGSAVKGNIIDIFFGSDYDAADQFGRRRLELYSIN